MYKDRIYSYIFHRLLCKYKTYHVHLSLNVSRFDFLLSAREANKATVDIVREYETCVSYCALLVDICRLPLKNTLNLIFVFASLDDGIIDLWKYLCVWV